MKTKPPPKYKTYLSMLSPTTIEKMNTPKLPAWPPSRYLDIYSLNDPDIDHAYDYISEIESMKSMMMDIRYKRDYYIWTPVGWK